MKFKKDETSESVEKYINNLLINELATAMPGHDLELAADLETDQLSIIVDDSRIYYMNSQVAGVNFVSFQCIIYKSFEPTEKLLMEVVQTSKNFVSINLFANADGSADLVISADLLLTTNLRLDAMNIAIFLKCIAEYHSELYDRWESL